MIGMHPRFRWLERGAGEPVVLLHGLMSDMHHWDATLDALEPMCRALALVLPIFDEAMPDVSVPALAGHVLRFLDALELDRAVVGGNSLGGHVALELALEHPDRVSALVLAGSSGLFERTFTRGVPHVPTAAFVRAQMEEAFHDGALVTESWVASVLRILTTRWLARRVVQVARSARRHNLEARLHEIDVPTLLVWGREDRITPLEVAERFRALIGGAELVVLPSCGHAPMLEQPATFNAALEEWLRRTRPLRPGVALVTGGAR